MWNKIQRIYVGDHYQVFPSWKPWTNTIGYRPLKSNLKDYSGNGYDFTTYSGTTSYVNWMVQTTGKLSRNNLITSLGNNFTILMYTVQANWETYLFTSSDRNYSNFYIGTNGTKARIMWWNNNVWYWPNVDFSGGGTPHLLVWVREWGSTVKLYIDWVKVGTSTVSAAIPSATYMVLWNVVSNTLSAKYWNLIMENRVWTDQEIADYYNQTKATYQWFN